MELSQHTINAPSVLQPSLRVTPQAKVVTLRFPFGSLVWNRPGGVRVERDGQVTQMPIVMAQPDAQHGADENAVGGGGGGGGGGGSMGRPVAAIVIRRRA